jgi:hypothetical protein
MTASTSLTPPSITTFDSCERRAQQLNSHCYKVALDQTALLTELEQRNVINLYPLIVEDRPHLFAESVVFITEKHIQKQLNIIAAIESTIALPAYQERVLTYAPDSAQFIPQAHGVFFGYDFHLSDEGPKLIEINSNAGGALINSLIFRHQTVCYDSSKPELSAPKVDLESLFFKMFLDEWLAEKGQQPLCSIAIVDENPLSQYMLPEFILFKKLFEEHDIHTVICDPSELVFHNQALWHSNQRIDLVYNRLTDFGLQAPVNKALLDAYLTKSVVLTPHPRAHALYADKRNLTLLTDEDFLINLGVDEKTKALLLNGIAHTISITSNDEQMLWDSRKHLFFKPAKGYGSKAAYRGDKLTRRVFSELLQNDYVAQTLVQPSEHPVKVEDKIIDLKLDLRHYVYKAKTQLISARLYQGQTTNFRTSGGGFAQVMAVTCHDDEVTH